MRTAPPRTLFSLVVCVLLAGCGGDTDSPPTPSPASPGAQTSTSYEEDPQPVPDTSLTTLDEGSVDLAASKGQVLLVNFWATWCAPCRKEIPDLIELHEEFGDDLVVVGVSLDKEPPDVVRSFVEEQNINYPIVHDPEGKVEAQFGGTYGIPTTFLVNPDGEIVRRIVGIFPTEELRPELESMIAAANDAA